MVASGTESGPPTGRRTKWGNSLFRERESEQYAFGCTTLESMRQAEDLSARWNFRLADLSDEMGSAYGVDA